MNSTKNIFSVEFKKWDGVEFNLVKKGQGKKIENNKIQNILAPLCRKKEGCSGNPR